MSLRDIDRHHGEGATTAAREVDPPPVTALRRKDLLGIADLSAPEITLILDTAEAMKEVATRPIKKVPALRGKTVVNLFFEPSTRTRTSFEIAEKRLSADTLNIAIGTSSVVRRTTSTWVTVGHRSSARSAFCLSGTTDPRRYDASCVTRSFAPA